MAEELNKDTEKVYKFIVSVGPGNEKGISVKESELTKEQKSLLLGEALWHYKELSKELQEKFLDQILICDCGKPLSKGLCGICDNDD